MRKLLFLLTIFIVLFSRVAFSAFVDNGDDTVTDTSTGLMWQKYPPAGKKTWEEAISYCDDLSLGGCDGYSYSDWRLPNRSELQSLVDYTHYNPAIDTAFPDPTVSYYYYWSSTTDVSVGGYAWYVDFSYGGVRVSSKSVSYYVRAVRGGNGSFGEEVHLPLDKILAGSIFEDIIGDHDGQANGFTSTDIVAGVIDKAAHFNGSNYISIPDSPDINVGTGDFTLSMWVRTNTQNKAILDKRGGAGGHGYHIYLYGKKPLFQINGPNGWSNNYNPSSSAKIVVDGTWHMVTITVDRDDPTGGRIYVDGKVDYVFDPRMDFGSLDNSSPLYLGMHMNGDKFVGDIDDFRFMKKELNEAEVSTLFCESKGSATAIVNGTVTIAGFNYPCAGAKVSISSSYFTGTVTTNSSGIYYFPATEIPADGINDFCSTVTAVWTPSITLTKSSDFCISHPVPCCSYEKNVPIGIMI